MSKILKVGVIGVGGIARVHFPGWKDSPYAEVVALADPDPVALNRAAQEQGVPVRYERPADLIADPDLDIVDICTPNMYHMPLVVAALDSGKHVLCEKPLAPTPDEIRAMIEARYRSGKLLMTAQHFRFDGKAQALKAEIDAGALGTVYHARSWMLRRAAMPTRPGFLLRQHSGGGACIDIGVHILDLTLWMMGNPKPVTVTGVTGNTLVSQPGAFSIWGGRPPITPDVEEFAAAFVRFDTGATLILEVSWLLHHNTPGEDMQMWLYGDRGGAHWPSNELLSSNYATQQLLNTQLQLSGTRIEPHALECMAFAEAVYHGQPSPVPAEQSLDVMSILDGLYRSAAAGREIVLDR